jgi:SsrA-binding protein
MTVLAKNRRATFDYELTDRLVAGLVLSGSEVKSLRAGHGSLKGSFIALREDEAYLMGAHITPYSHAADKTLLDPTRQRKLLLHRREISRLIAAKQAGLSVVPTVLITNHRLVKIEIGIGRGKKQFDKRQTIRRRDTERDVARQVKR